VKKTFTATLIKHDSLVWGHHVLVPKKVSDAFVKKGVKRVIATFGGEVRNQIAFMPNGDGVYFLNVNKEIRKQLGLNFGEKVKVTIEPDESKYGIELCEEMEVLLEQDEKGSAIFHKLTIGKQRSLIYLASKPKRSETRLKKSINILEYLKQVNGKLDFRDLQQYFKDHK